MRLAARCDVHARAAEAIRATTFSQAEIFAARCVLTPPREAETLQMYGGSGS